MENTSKFILGGNRRRLSPTVIFEKPNSRRVSSIKIILKKSFLWFFLKQMMLKQQLQTNLEDLITTYLRTSLSICIVTQKTGRFQSMDSRITVSLLTTLRSMSTIR